MHQADVETRTEEDSVPITDIVSKHVRSLRGKVGAHPALLQIRGSALRELEGVRLNGHLIGVVPLPRPSADLLRFDWAVGEEPWRFDDAGRRACEDEHRPVDVRVDANDAPRVERHPRARARGEVQVREL